MLPFAGRIGVPLHIVVELLLRRLALLLCGCIVRSRLKPAEFESLPFGLLLPLLGRFRLGKQLCRPRWLPR